MGADVEQTGDAGQDAGEHREGGTWLTAKDAAEVLDVSVDTIKRRMKRGELEARRETIPQGFRWLVRVDSPKTEAVGLPESHRNDNPGIEPPSDSPDIVEALLHELEVRNREIASMHATIAALTHAVEHVYQVTATVEATESPESAPATDESVGDVVEPTAPQRGVWARLRGWLMGE